jgi:ABC-type Mn2+/Zn2+ transport system permease subunit
MNLHTVLSPFQFEFFVNGLLVATLSGALCGLVGVYVVLKGMSYIGHGLSHAIFGGFAASALLGVNFFLGAGAWGFAAAMMINGVTRRRSIGSDAAIGVITTASFAIGVALIKRYGSGGKNPDSLLFGQILGVSDADVWLLAAVMVVAVLVVFFLYRPLLFSTFDPEVAEVSGVATARVDALLTLVLAASILATMTVLGVTLVAATLVIPAVVARMLTDSFGRMLLLATAIGAACGFVGMNLSYHLDIPSGPMIVLTGSGLFAVVFAATGRRGLRRAGGLHEHTGTVTA